MKKQRFHYSWTVLAMSTMVVFGSLGLARFGYTLVLPSMQTALGIENAQAGALASANLIGYLALSLIGGALASRFGPRVVITGGLGLAGVSLLLTGTVETFAAAFVWRAAAGIGSGASNVPVMGLVSSWFGIRRRGFAAGIAVTGSSIALIVLGPLVPALLDAYGDNGWRVCWYVYGAATLILAAAARLVLRNSPDELDIEAFGVTADDPPRQTGTALHWGLVYRSGRVWVLGLVYVAFGFSYIIYMTFFFKHLIAQGGYSRESAGGLFMLVGWLSLFCGLVWGAISDHIGRKRTLMLVYLLQAASFSLFALWQSSAGYTVSAVLFGLTAWSIPAIMAATCGDVLGPRLAPAALGFITLFFGVGQALGPSVAGVMADTTGSFDSAFLLAGGVALLGAFGALMIRDSNRRGVSG